MAAPVADATGDLVETSLHPRLHGVNAHREFLSSPTHGHVEPIFDDDIDYRQVGLLSRTGRLGGIDRISGTSYIQPYG